MESYDQSLKMEIDRIRTLGREAIQFEDYERAADLFNNEGYSLSFSQYQRAINIRDLAIEKLRSSKTPENVKPILEKMVKTFSEHAKSMRKKLLDLNNVLNEFNIKIEKLRENGEE